MSSKVQIAIHGLKELDQALMGMTKSLQRQALRKGVAAGARVLGRKMKELAPNSRVTGTKQWSKAQGRDSAGRFTKKQWNHGKQLRNSIKVRPSGAWRSRAAVAAKGIIGASVGPEWPYGAHAHLLEFGHALVAWGRSTSQRVKPYPFLRPAMDTSGAAVVAAQRAAISEWVRNPNRGALNRFMKKLP